MKDKVYDLYKVSEGVDNLGHPFVSVLIAIRNSKGSEPVAMFNHPSCNGCLAGRTWRNDVKTLEFFLEDSFEPVINEVKQDGYSCVAVNKNDKGKRIVTPLLRRFPKD